MEPGIARGIVNVAAGALAIDSAAAWGVASIASFGIAFASPPVVGPVGAVVAVQGGFVFGGLAVFDLYLSASYFERALQDFDVMSVDSEAPP